MPSGGTRPAVAAALAILACLCASPPAGAVLSGENGRIVFTSGRSAGDAAALIYFLPVPSPTVGGGTLSDPITPAGGQYRHPTWSPDRTKIAYANGTAGNFEIFVQDVAAGTGPMMLTDSGDNLSEDRPAWSPDGTRLAWEHQPSSGSADRNIRVTTDLVPPLNPLAVTDLTTSATFEGKPAWSPDSATIYFHAGDPQTAVNANIMKIPSTGGAATLAVSDSGISEFQPSISPDGTQICYTLSNNGFNNTADVVVGALTSPPSGGLIISADNTLGDYNCTWSPDGTMIAYVNGTFSAGRLVMERADNTSPEPPVELAQDPGGDNFDGNPDWAPDGRPDCPDRTVSTVENIAVTFTVECTDTGPDYEQSEVREFSGTDPNNGTLEQELAGDPFTYTPNQGFTGNDAFQVRSFDDLGFGVDQGKITLEVQAADEGGGGGGGGGGGDEGPIPTTCAGRTATLLGTPLAETILGTPRRDVIVALGGNDTIRGRGKRDVICGLGGRDRIFGNGGKDTIRGGKGRDRLFGGLGRDRLFGGSRRDLLFGGPGRDRCRGGAGRDRLVSCP
jgi:Tol biopolymer transport system component